MQPRGVNRIPKGFINPLSLDLELYLLVIAISSPLMYFRFQIVVRSFCLHLVLLCKKHAIICVQRPAGGYRSPLIRTNWSTYRGMVRCLGVGPFGYMPPRWRVRRHGRLSLRL
ncbi:hypothetical protein COCSADRAFT_273452 [Bipolaris sorokiniana ND90Pr]|uniref:Uncharacterized protein n=1 Tax=Cochliobolus sativus (strain ND90Pr / ATCC 201652) TaxID=665912 RepID=M2TH09_COCSN|nr:uncharacterized protein COCSADRAFT_273452 [Bipolaris sorokiniana ND90Pr]EMD68516.1 hypothetical protein COCSADRAFT_273452 [Bipolaris sorokiniana ND90Pr]